MPLRGKAASLIPIEGDERRPKMEIYDLLIALADAVEARLPSRPESLPARGKATAGW